MPELDPKTQIERVKSQWSTLVTEGTNARFVLMVGAADFFERERGTRPFPLELIRLLNFVRETPDRKTYVLAVDSSYTSWNIMHDIENINKLILQNLSKPARTELFARHNNFKQLLGQGEYHFNETYEENKGDNLFFQETSYLTNEELSSDYSFPVVYYYKDLLEIAFCKTDLETSYKQEGNNLEEIIFGRTNIPNLVETCIPRENTLMYEIQSFCRDIAFAEYYLYNCAWIGGSRLFARDGRVNRNTGKQNRHFELMCELLHIFRNLGRPAFLLGGEGMRAFTHNHTRIVPGNLRIPTENTSLQISPLNNATRFIKVPRGGYKTRRRNKKRKITRKH